jgi:hypothetical protein
MARENEDKDQRTVEQILQDVEGAARQKRKRYSGVISIAGAVLLVVAAAWFLIHRMMK